MTPQILPGTTDILRCVREVTRDILAPTLTGHSERSAAATIDHMLRYVEGLIDHQGQALLDEETRLKTLLPGIADWLADQPEQASLASVIRASVTRTRDAHVYPTLQMMADDVAVLRQHVCDALLALQKADKARGADGEAAYQALRDYIRWQLEEEGKLVQPAFLGHGPRR